MSRYLLRLHRGRKLLVREDFIEAYELLPSWWLGSILNRWYWLLARAEACPPTKGASEPFSITHGGKVLSGKLPSSLGWKPKTPCEAAYHLVRWISSRWHTRHPPRPGAPARRPAR